MEGKVTSVYRKKFCIYIDRHTKERAQGGTVKIPLDPSNVEITQLKMDRNRQEKLNEKLRSRNADRARKGLAAQAGAGEE